MNVLPLLESRDGLALITHFEGLGKWLKTLPKTHPSGYFAGMMNAG
jgi:hypothetical protein